jgi:ESCRT-II complex subunit VPS22
MLLGRTTIRHVRRSPFRHSSIHQKPECSFMSRRQVGLGALDRTSTSIVSSFPASVSNFQAQYQQIANSLTAQNITDLTTQLTSFQSSLQTFALRHADEIRKNPQLRSEFARMCASIGVDPLAGVTSTTRKREERGWGLLGVGEFWITVGTRVVGICRRTRGENGGFISVAEVKRILGSEDNLSRQRSGARDIVEISEYVRI